MLSEDLEEEWESLARRIGNAILVLQAEGAERDRIPSAILRWTQCDRSDPPERCLHEIENLAKKAIGEHQ